jgi:hypothetical protein
MKTAMEKLINHLTILKDDADGVSAEVYAYEKAIEKAQELLWLEREQIRVAFCDGEFRSDMYFEHGVPDGVIYLERNYGDSDYSN